MSHPSEDDWILHFYGEAGDSLALEEHIHSCARCREEMRLLREALSEVGDAAPPERGDDYGRRVWERIAKELPRAGWRRAPARYGYLLAAAAAVLLATFLAGRFSARRDLDDAGEKGREIRERILLVALGDHLQASQVLLLEIANRGEVAAGPLDRDRAEELLRASRLYRQSALRLGDVATADVLEDLERLLLDVSHEPDTVEAHRGIRTRMEERDVLFKLRVLEASVRHRGERPAAKKL
jgi:hypothetical protein